MKRYKKYMILGLFIAGIVPLLNIAITQRIIAWQYLVNSAFRAWGDSAGFIGFLFGALLITIVAGVPLWVGFGLLLHLADLEEEEEKQRGGE